MPKRLQYRVFEGDKFIIQGFSKDINEFFGKKDFVEYWKFANKSYGKRKPVKYRIEVVEPYFNIYDCYGVPFEEKELVFTGNKEQCLKKLYIDDRSLYGKLQDQKCIVNKPTIYWLEEFFPQYEGDKNEQ